MKNKRTKKQKPTTTTTTTTTTKRDLSFLFKGHLPHSIRYVTLRYVTLRYAKHKNLVRDGNLDLNPRLDGDGSNLPDDGGVGVQVDEPLVDPHLEPVPGVGTLAARRLPGGDPELLRRHANGAGDAELLVHRGTLQVSADLLQVLDVAGGKGDADAVDLLRGGVH